MSGHAALYTGCPVHQVFSHPGMAGENPRLDAGNGIHREGDIISRIPLKAGGEAYLALLEFQLVQDPWMALPVMVYAGMPWQRLPGRKFASPLRLRY